MKRCVLVAVLMIGVGGWVHGTVAAEVLPGAAADTLPGAASLRAAIEDLSAAFPAEYPKGKEYLARLDAVKTPEELDALRNEALLANPLLCRQPILFAARPQYAPDHHNTETMFQTCEINTRSFRGGGALKAVDFRQRDASGKPRLITLVEAAQGIARDPDVSFDGKRVLFSMRRDRDDDYHLYEVNADGSGLRQLTYGKGISDIDPIYLPDGRILFTSTREPKYCMCNRHIMGNLFTIDGDGANIQQIGHSTLHEGHASLMPDGRVLYDRWEYVDRNFGNAQGLWTSNPDGTNHVIYYGNNTESPGAKLDGRPIPGTELVVCTFSSCHDRPWGALAIVDRRAGTDGREPVVRTWPEGAINLVGHGGFDTFARVYPKYEDPYPLSDKYFLCARQTGHGEQMGIYLVDTFGNEILVYAEAPGCFDPMPLTGREKPPVIPSRIDLTKSEGSFYVLNVYEGSGMEKINKGSVKYLRVVESPEKRYWTKPAWDGNTGQQAPGMGWNDFNNKRILGTVPVEADGSVYFSVPADRFVYFQLLDEKGMMVQSMRSGTTVRPGERQGCVGCHENRQTSAALGDLPAALAKASLGIPQALRREPSKLEPWHGEPRLFGYLAEVQPVLDKHCVSCHDYGKPAGEKLNLAGDLNTCFNASYVELRTKNYVHVVGAGPAAVQMPKTWGSHASLLAKVLIEGHGKPEIDKEVKLDAESLDRLITWIDINAPYYPSYAGGAYRDNPYGRSPIDKEKLYRLERLTGISHNHRNMAMVSFTRPEMSPCLAKLDKQSAEYREALEILIAGKEALARNPRPDMPGFQLTDPIEIEQEAKYQALRKAEEEAKAAILAGKKQYDRPSP